jgi:uncharacterized protein (TIGR02001 family)
VSTPRRRCACSAALGAAGLALSLAAQAQFGASVAADSDYRVRGVTLTDGGPTLRATLNYDAPGGWYIGAMATRVELAPGDRYEQVMPYAGIVVPFGEQRRVEFGATISHFTGDAGYDYAEAYAGLLADRWSARLYCSPNYFGRHLATAYAELNGHAVLAPHVRLFAHVGVLSPLGRAAGDANKARFDLRVGTGLSVGDLDLQIAWVAATQGGPYPAIRGGRRTAWVAGASFSF